MTTTTEALIAGLTKEELVEQLAKHRSALRRMTHAVEALCGDLSNYGIDVPAIYEEAAELEYNTLFGLRFEEEGAGRVVAKVVK